MLRQLRSAEKLKKILWIALLIVVIPSMVMFVGFGSGGAPAAKGGQVIATINYPEGSKGQITPVELRSARSFLQSRIEAYAQDQRIMLNPQNAGELTNDSTVIDYAVNMDILRHFAEINGISVTKGDAIDYIQKVTTPEQRQMLEQQWKSQGRSVDDVLEDQRKSMVIARATDSIGSKVRATHYEAWQDYLKDNEQLVINSYKINAADKLASVTVTEEGLNKYFEDNKEKFRIPDQVQYQYVLVRKDDLKSSVTLTDDDVTSYYNNNKEEFRLPRKVEASQIFLKLPNPQEMNTTSAETFTSLTEAVTAKADEAYERAAKGEDFAALANSLTQEDNFPPRVDDQTTAADSATTAGGNLGLISEEVAKTWYGDSWTSAVFNTSEGGITRPIRTDNMGYAVVQVKKIIQGDIQPLDQVRPLIENKLRDQKVEPVFEAMGAQMAKALETMTGLQQIASATSGVVVTSKKTDKDAKFIEGIGLLGDFQEAIADLEKGGHSDVLSDLTRHLVIQLKEEFPSHVPDLKDVRGRVEQSFKQKLSEDAARAEADELFKKSENHEKFTQALKDLGTSYTQSRPFKRAEAPAIFGGMAEGFTTQSANLKAGQILQTEVGRPGMQLSYVIWHVDQVIEPSKTDFAKDLGKIIDRLTSTKSQVAVLDYIRDQRAKLGDRIKVESFQ